LHWQLFCGLVDVFDLVIVVGGLLCGMCVTGMVCRAYGVQHIWDEVGESDVERDKMLLQLEQECLEVYRRKVDAASLTRSRLHQALASAEAEFSALFSALGEPALSQRVSQSITCLPLRSNSTKRSSGCNTSSINLQWFCSGSVLRLKLMVYCEPLQKCCKLLQ